MAHYTSTDQGAFVEKVMFDFIGQIAQRLESSETTQTAFADQLGVTDSEVSQVLNLNRVNLTLKTMVKYARALGMKVAIVAYDDGDPTNQNGPVNPDIFYRSWNKLGQPRDIWSVNNFAVANSSERQCQIFTRWHSRTTDTSAFRRSFFQLSQETWSHTDARS
jgi:transcriptional regulator with XRE-family HTH domain